MSAEDLMKPLEAYLASIHQECAGLVKKVRHSEQLGLTQARLSGWRVASGDVVAILDAHIEVQVQWCVKIAVGGGPVCVRETLPSTVTISLPAPLQGRASIGSHQGAADCDTHTRV